MKRESGRCIFSRIAQRLPIVKRVNSVKILNVFVCTDLKDFYIYTIDNIIDKMVPLFFH